MAIVGAIATLAAVGVQAAQAAGAFDSGQSDALGGGRYVPPSLQERLFNRGTREIMSAERLILDDSLAQGKLLEPSMYAALGLEPVYDRPEDPAYADLSNQLSGQQDRMSEIQRERAALNAERPGQGLRGKAKERAIRDKQRRMRQLTREFKLASRNVATLTRDVELKGAVGRRVVGFKPLGGVADPTGSAGNAFGAALNSFNSHLSDALAGKEPLDPTLKSTFDERERDLRNRLRAQLGPDYETSTAGDRALANFAREKSEAFAQYNTQTIQNFSALSENRARALSDLTSGRLKNLAFPAAFRAELAKNLESSARTRLGVSGAMAEERGGQAEAAFAALAAERQDSARRQAALQNLAGAVSGAAPTIGSYAGELGTKINTGLVGTAGPSQADVLAGARVPVGSEFDTSGLIGAGGKVGNLAGLR